MYKYGLLLLAVVCAVSCEEARKHRIEDPFAALDRHITHTLAYHYLWPWNQLIKAAAAIDAEENLEEPQIQSDDDKIEIRMNVKRFKPDELRVKVKNRYILVEGKHKEASHENRFMANHFVQRFVLPLGSKQEEVTAVLNEKGYLVVSAPKHVLPPPPPEREVPIEVRLPEKTEKPTQENTTTDKKEETVKKEETLKKGEPVKEEITTEKIELPAATTLAPALEQLDSEATTVHGKIRKKELKTTTKVVKDNEVTKGGEGNGLDYALIEADE